MTEVAVFGGGVAGLSAAHELVERGYAVTVYEARDVFGGKARSIPVPNSATPGRSDLPAEHGFRFFPSFYRHVVETMSRIPSGGTTAYGHLVETTRMMMAQSGDRRDIVGVTSVPGSWTDLEAMVKFVWDLGVDLRVPPRDLAFYFERLLILLCSCDERRFGEFEKKSWWEFTQAECRSEQFRTLMAMTRTLVAAKPDKMSARTGGLVSTRLLSGLGPSVRSVDRVLNGPTSEVWINPWVSYLRQKGVQFRASCEITEIHCEAGHLTGATARGRNGSEHVDADYYVAALPVERFTHLLTAQMRAADPQLCLLDELETSWMNGAMFYLRTDVPIVHGHVIFPNSEWALTAISQRQFWDRQFDFGSFGNGTIGGILSVDISEWHQPGRVTGKAAADCTAEEIRAEVWAQITDAIDNDVLDEKNVSSWFLDPDIVIPNPCRTTNCEPLLINTPDSWGCRPCASTRIDNLFLASDYVRTYTDLATMEAANEAARRAVNAILEASGSTADRCELWRPPEPAILKPFRKLDRLLWRLGRPPAKPPFRAVDGKLRPANRPMYELLQASSRITERYNGGRQRRTDFS